jgi:hypothetical protein
MFMPRPLIVVKDHGLFIGKDHFSKAVDIRAIYETLGIKPKL